MAIVTDRRIQNKSQDKHAEKPMREMSAEALFAACRPDNRSYRTPVSTRINWAYRPGQAVR
jgi:hypothetical protein